jgi:hypothetical protein
MANVTHPTAQVVLDAFSNAQITPLFARARHRPNL